MPTIVLTSESWLNQRVRDIVGEDFQPYRTGGPIDYGSLRVFDK
jgi:hypothetical protein